MDVDELGLCGGGGHGVPWGKWTVGQPEVLQVGFIDVTLFAVNSCVNDT
jgi:hypothetical protein